MQGRTLCCGCFWRKPPRWLAKWLWATCAMQPRSSSLQITFLKASSPLTHAHTHARPTARTHLHAHTHAHKNACTNAHTYLLADTSTHIPFLLLWMLNRFAEVQGMLQGSCSVGIRPRILTAQSNESNRYLRLEGRADRLWRVL